MPVIPWYLPMLVGALAASRLMCAFLERKHGRSWKGEAILGVVLLASFAILVF